MGTRKRDTGLDALLDLDGEVFVVDEDGRYVARIRAKRVPVTAEKPHGLDYSLTLHDENGRRIVGFDNAHPFRPTRGPSGRSRKSQDHEHRGSSTRTYRYEDAATLLADFWTEVDKALGGEDGR